MSLCLYFLRAGLQARDPFFGNPKQIYVRSALINDDFLAKVLLEAERSSGWHSSLPNPCNHYTLQGYNRAGWMSVTVEMEHGNHGSVYTYEAQHWNRWLARAGGQSNLRAKHFFDPADHVECLFTSCREFGLREYVLSVECGDVPYKWYQALKNRVIHFYTWYSLDLTLQGYLMY
ncbi:hypothetical protein EDD18DRAFT_1114007 [Armillaria luteobubalina]|uniref:Uncharacterized protein n=1 Tax=Armillaria luteobubalina TaxID=153913 RepID=A0AA39P7J3_9AGAR|nr:hypothetical protein EDD18DRAFT_1114007 [Armillaria luteobubalina]